MKRILMDWIVKMYIWTIIKYLNFKMYNYQKRIRECFYLLEQPVLFPLYGFLQLQLMIVVTIHRIRLLVIIFMEINLHQAILLLMLIYSFNISIQTKTAYLCVIRSRHFYLEMDVHSWTYNLQITFYTWLIIQIYQTQLTGAKFKYNVRAEVLYKFPHHKVLTALVQVVLYYLMQFIYIQCYIVLITNNLCIIITILVVP